MLLLKTCRRIRSLLPVLVSRPSLFSFYYVLSSQWLQAPDTGLGCHFLMCFYCCTEIALWTQQCPFLSCCSIALEPKQKALKWVSWDISILKRKKVNLSPLLYCLWLVRICGGNYFCKSLADTQDKLAVTWLSWWCQQSTVFNQIIFWCQIFRKLILKKNTHLTNPPMSMSWLSYRFSLQKWGVDNSFIWSTWQECSYNDDKRKDN